jgi:hypothetical protein
MARVDAGLAAKAAATRFSWSPLFEHRFGQFLEKQRHPVCALDDLGDDLHVERGFATQVPHQRDAFAPAQPVERHHRHMRLPAPAMLKLRPESDDQQDGKPPDPVELQVEQFTRAWVDPLRVLKYHQDGAAARHRFELAEQGLEQFLALALRAQIEVGDGVRKRQQFGEERDFVGVTGSRSQQRFELAELSGGRVVAREAGRAFELNDEGWSALS